MDFRILGPLVVSGIPDAPPLRQAKPRAVLAMLVLNANEPVSVERLATAVWGDDAPPGAARTVHVYISRLRKALGIRTGSSGRRPGTASRSRPASSISSASRARWPRGAGCSPTGSRGRRARG